MTAERWLTWGRLSFSRKHVGDLARATRRDRGPSEAQGKRHVLFVDQFEESMGALAALGATLPFGSTDWEVELIARRDGYIGKFRRCWECRRWFQGRAEFHKYGHVK